MINPRKNIISLSLLLGSLISQAQTMHLIMFCDTDDDRIGQGVIHDHDNAIREFSNIAEYIEYDIRITDKYGAECNKATLIQSLDNLSVSNDDIIVFLYSGHGTRSNDDINPFPQMCLGSSYDSDFVPLKHVVDNLKQKNPKFLLCISNCCNKESPGVTVKSSIGEIAGPTRMSQTDVSAYRKLFCNASGQAVITGCKAGQYSYINLNTGGFFINDFFDVLLLVGQGVISPTWESTFSNVRDKTSVRQIATSYPPYTATQTPYYEININKNTPIPRNRKRYDDNPYNRFDGNNTTIVAESINFLVADYVPQEIRLKYIPSIISRYFSPDAKIRIVGRNGKTIEYTDVNKYFNQLVLSKRIVRVTVIRETRNSKITELTVHEIRK